MSVLLVCTDPSAVSPIFDTFQRSKNVYSERPTSAGVQFRNDQLHVPEVTRKCSESRLSESRLWRIATRESSRSRASIKSLGQKARATLTCAISGGSSILKQTLRRRDYADDASDVYYDPRLSESGRQEAESLLAEQARHYEVSAFLLPIF
ncbi:hypothetical protein PILCRDRAFT_810014 [Piloderma croceum F 1598]|uniref:Uncharacterized protein n=1 Tax=Piloderma croceum (strain F 1598) TaxID=765440 RepID=A0A0C3GNA5_PILCF|nr:hypothetical protein PILCRDRAFT_810014 [Piloderma croceum F 1598]